MYKRSDRRNTKPSLSEVCTSSEEHTMAVLYPFQLFLATSKQSVHKQLDTPRACCFTEGHLASYIRATTRQTVTPKTCISLRKGGGAGIQLTTIFSASCCVLKLQLRAINTAADCKSHYNHNTSHIKNIILLGNVKEGSILIIQ